MSLFRVDPAKCRRDGICASVCPAGLIAPPAGDGLPQALPEAAALCINCGHCAAACPHAALELAAMPLVGMAELKRELKVSPEQAAQFLASRRSIRNFKPDPLDRETLQQMLEVVAYAPSGHNTQPVAWLVIQGRERLDPLAGLVIAWMKALVAAGNPLAEQLHMDRVVRRWGEGRDVILRGAPVVAVAHAAKDDRTAPAACTIALAYLELIAHGRGLGACWAGFFNAAANFYPPMQAALELPAGHAAFGAMMLGQTGERYWRLPARKAPAVTWR
ncbi:MAG: nitroreductase family protein [Thermodesulfobacteriota bacterium]